MLSISVSQLHAFLVHFPIVLFPLAVIFELIGLYKSREDLRGLGWYFHIATTVFVTGAIATGILAKENLTGQQLRHIILEAHEVLALLFSIMIFALFLYRIARRGKLNSQKIGLYQIFMFLALIILFVTGHFGGMLVYQLGYGLP